MVLKNSRIMDIIGSIFFEPVQQDNSPLVSKKDSKTPSSLLEISLLIEHTAIMIERMLNECEKKAAR